jgi:hypothetical protein
VGSPREGGGATSAGSVTSGSGEDGEKVAWGVEF